MKFTEGWYIISIFFVFEHKYLCRYNACNTDLTIEEYWFVSSQRQDPYVFQRINLCSVALSATYSMSITSLSLRLKRPRREADYLAKSNVEVKNAWNLAFTPTFLHDVVLNQAQVQLLTYFLTCSHQSVTELIYTAIPAYFYIRWWLIMWSEIFTFILFSPTFSTSVKFK